jgi:hypothetical protein
MYRLYKGYLKNLNKRPLVKAATVLIQRHAVSEMADVLSGLPVLASSDSRANFPKSRFIRSNTSVIINSALKLLFE